MSVYVFCGPTISVDDASTVLNATYLPPVSQGDVYRIACSQPIAIGIIDGYFHQVPSVWHKEILWAIKQGIAVYGSASIGALRAAELAPFGMHGIGSIYEDYSAGRLEDDDEVALLHGPPETGFRPISESLVNIRATLKEALHKEIIDGVTHSMILRAAKSTHYKRRSYTNLITICRCLDIASDMLDALAAWLPGGAVDQKKLDAIAMLRTMHDNLKVANLHSNRPSFSFQHTVFFDQIIRAQHIEETELDTTLTTDKQILNEIRLTGVARHLVRAATTRALALKEAQRHFEIRPVDIENTKRELRMEMGLTEDDSWKEWIVANGLSSMKLAKLLAEEASLRAASRHAEMQPDEALLNYLRLHGELEPFVERARAKQRLLGNREVTPEMLRMTVEEVVRWYVSLNIRSLELGSRLEYQALINPDNFTDLLLREYLYIKLKGEEETE